VKFIKVLSSLQWLGCILVTY